MKKINPTTAFVFGVSITAAFFLGAGAGSIREVPDRIQARSFEVVNADGNVVVQMSSAEDSGVVRVISKTGKTCALVTSSKNVGGLSLFIEEANTLFLGATDDRLGGSISIYDTQDHKLATLGTGLAHMDTPAGFLFLRHPTHDATMNVCFSTAGYPMIEGNRPSTNRLWAWPATSDAAAPKKDVLK